MGRTAGTFSLQWGRGLSAPDGGQARRINGYTGSTLQWGRGLSAPDGRYLIPD